MCRELYNQSLWSYLKIYWWWKKSLFCHFHRHLNVAKAKIALEMTLSEMWLGKIIFNRLCTWMGEEKNNSTTKRNFSRDLIKSWTEAVLNHRRKKIFITYLLLKFILLKNNHEIILMVSNEFFISPFFLRLRIKSLSIFFCFL